MGKGTVSARLRELHPEIWISVSATTRSPRPGEIDGVHYHFLSKGEFERLIKDGEMLEWAVVHGQNSYGTPRQPVVEALRAGRPTLLDIDLQGARQVKEAMPEAQFVFLAPPSWDELVRRLIGRGTETPQEQTRRLETAKVEMAAEAEFDVTIVNDNLDEAVAQLVAHIHNGNGNNHS